MKILRDILIALGVLIIARAIFNSTQAPSVSVTNIDWVAKTFDYTISIAGRTVSGTFHYPKDGTAIYNAGDNNQYEMGCWSIGSGVMVGIHQGANVIKNTLVDFQNQTTKTLKD